MTSLDPGTKLRAAVVVGTRPEAIKMAPIIKEFKARTGSVDLLVVNTAQHREMIDQVLSIFDIEPDIDLNLMEQNQAAFSFVSKILPALGRVLERHRPHILLVEGDTSTVFATSLMAFYNRIDVGHVEAGLRTRDIYQPFPEEMNRRVTSVLATLHFAPTAWAKDNLLREGHSEASIFVTGNPVVDALLSIVDENAANLNSRLPQIDFDTKKLVLITVHRRENHGQPLINVCKAVLRLAERYEDIVFVYPVHPNPNVQDVVKKHLADNSRILLTDPMDYLTFVQLMKHCHLILTDSGGIQEEAPTFGKPVLVLRNKTERPEAVDTGIARIVGTETDRIIKETALILNDENQYKSMVASHNPFGDGTASRQIVDIIESYYRNQGYVQEQVSASPSDSL